MLSRRQFLRSTAAVVAVTAVGVPAIAIAAQTPKPICQIELGPGGISKMIPFPGWRWRITPSGGLIHEPIPGGLTRGQTTSRLVSHDKPWGWGGA